MAWKEYKDAIQMCRDGIRQDKTEIEHTYGKTEGPFHSKHKQRNAETEVGALVSLPSDGDKIP